MSNETSTSKSGTKNVLLEKKFPPKMLGKRIRKFLEKSEHFTREIETPSIGQSADIQVADLQSIFNQPTANWLNRPISRFSIF